MLSKERIKRMKVLGIRIPEQEISSNMDRHTQNPFMGDTESQRYDKILKQIARHKQFGILIPDELVDELFKATKALENKSNVESIIDNGDIVTAKALGMAVPIQGNNAINKTTEVNRERHSQLFGIRKLGSKVKSIVQPEAETGLQKVNARMASTGLARLRKAIPRKTRITMILNAKHSAMITVFGIIINALMMMRNFNVTNDALYILNVEVNKIKGKLASGEPGQSDQGRTQLLGKIGEKMAESKAQVRGWC